MEAPIPTDWLQPVLAILRSGVFGREIQCPITAQKRWDADTFGAAFLGDVREPLIAALSVPGVAGKHIADQPEPGVTYAFWFFYNNRKFYGKICLYENKIKLKLLSAHRPNKGEEFL
jgi:hypothetical protein